LGKVLSAWACETGGAYGGILKMAPGNMIGFTGDADDCLFHHLWGSIVFESDEELEGFRLLGYTQTLPEIALGETKISLSILCEIWESTLESVFPVKTAQYGDAPMITDKRNAAAFCGASFARPKAVITVFPGTNCEYDTAAAIERAGGTAEIILVRNLTPEMLSSSVIAIERAISSAQMIVFPGGFSGGDEPDGSGKFIASLFRNQRLANAIHELLDRDGLILGICNGFQALIKLGLLPYGRISDMTPDCPALTFNRIGRHQSRYVSTRISSVISPWLSECTPGEIYVQPVSHGEGRFAASAETLNTLKANGQIAFQYVDYDGIPSMDIKHNPNGSAWAAEGICSPDGRVLGKMAHSERYGEYVAKNVPGNKYLPLFEGGVNYFK
jgi:phosphoribosylformylglycinamidine synthase